MSKQGNLIEEANKYGWDRILPVLAPEFTEAIDERMGRGMRASGVTCPVHGTSNSSGRGDGFIVFKDFESTGGGHCNSCGSFPNGILMLSWMLQSRKSDVGIIYRKEIKQEYKDEAEGLIADFLQHGSALYPEVRERSALVNAISKEEEEKRELNLMFFNRRIGEAMWRRSNEFHPMIESYLNGRGHKNPEITSFMRLSESTPYFDDKNVKYFDAMLLPIVIHLPGDESRVVGLHRIYLEEENFMVRKASVGMAKKMLKFEKVSGGCIPLYPLAGDTLAVCEGPETAIAIRELSGLPVWSGISSGLMSRMLIPKEIRHVIIGADHDESKAGIKAAMSLKERMAAEGRSCTILCPDMFPFPPPVPGSTKKATIDWETALVNHADHAYDLWAAYRVASSPSFKK